MSRPTILIGIGSGGLRSIEAAWKLSQEIPSDAERPLVEYIYLETDGSNKAVSSEIVSCPLTLNDINASKAAVEHDVSATTAWVHNQNFSSNVMNGAGGSPVVGRMTIWDKNNRQFFQNAINNAVGRLNTVSLEKPVVYIVGSFGGGTGSGTFLDIAYIVRDQLANQVEVQGLFMVPNAGLSDRVIYSNTVCCIKELEYFNDENNEFPFRWNPNPPRGYQKQDTPYDLVQVISASYDSGLATVTYSQLHDEAGLFLYLNMLGLYDVRRKSLVDASGNVIVSKYTTYGIAALHYPENEIKDIISNEFGSDLLKGIIDTQHYYDKETTSFKDLNAGRAIVRNNVSRIFESRFEEILRKWCEAIEIVDDSETLPVDHHLKSLASMLASGNFTYDDKRKKLYSLFKVGGEYYKQLKSLCSSSAIDATINLVIEIISDTLKEYQNINLAIEAIDSVEVSVQNVLNFWNANGYVKDPQKWDMLIREGIVKEILPMPKTFAMQFESERVYEDRLKYLLLYGLAMHIFAENMERIANAINGNIDAAGQRIVMSTSDNAQLPSKYMLNEWKHVLTHVKSDNNPAYKSCDQVVDALRTKLSQNANGNIEYLYPDGTLEETITKVKGNYLSKNGNVRVIKDVVSHEDLYQFLITLEQNMRQNDFSSEHDLYKKITQGYFDVIDCGTFSVAEAVQNGSQLEKLRLVVSKAKIPHIPVNPTGRNAVFQEHKNIPHVLAGFDGANGGVLKTIEAQLTQHNVQGFEISDNDRNAFSHMGLNNWLIFYKEFGRMSDDRPFNIINDLRDFETYATNYYADMLDCQHTSNMTPQQYHEKRMPYLPYNTCMTMAQKYIQDANALYKNGEWEKSVLAFQYAKYWDMSNDMPQNQIKLIKQTIEQEDAQRRFDRYVNIANSFSQQQDYPKAKYYYSMASKVIAGDPYVVGQIQQIDAIALNVNNLVSQADMMSIAANADYEMCLQNHDRNAAQNCIQSYQEILAIYNQALALSRHDDNVLHKIANINRSIQNLNNL